MRPEPADATVYIDDEKVPTEKGLFTATMKKGSHTYRVESPILQELNIPKCMLPKPV